MLRELLEQAVAMSDMLEKKHLEVCQQISRLPAVDPILVEPGNKEALIGNMPLAEDDMPLGLGQMLHDHHSLYHLI